MKLKLIACAVVALAASMGMTYAQGTFGFGIELDGTGAYATNSGTLTLYALDNSGTTRLEPSSGAPKLVSSWTGSSTPASPSFNLGTFYTGSTLTLDGGSMLTFKSTTGGQNVSQSDLFYTIYAVGSSAGTFNDVSLLFNFDNVAGEPAGSDDQRWATENGYGNYPQGGTGTFTGINLLSGLAPGTYILDVYGDAQSTAGTLYESNMGANFAAEFTVVPEPSTWAMMFGGLGMLLCIQRLRRKSVS